ncbi:MAG TPA: Na+/H+ antiporter NhaC family protein [Bacilli bacterium]|nr:Na+/H+ antiporter NhaC family protein [Bacilli bacterium]
MSAGKSIPLGWALVPFAVTITGLVAALLLFHLPLYVGLLAGWLSAVLIALCYGKGWRLVGQGTWLGAKSTFFVIGILLLIAGVISTWLISGTVPGLIRYGIQLVQPQYLVVAAFLLTLATSFALGTSVGTLSTMGVAIIGMAKVFGLPPALVGGALISGAMFGDRMSPVSGTFHLVANMTGTKAEDNYKPMLQTAVPMVLICFGLYLWLGYGKASGPLDPLDSPLLVQLQTYFALPWYVLLPPALVLVLALFRVPIRRNLLLGILFGMGLAVFVQKESWAATLGALAFGYELKEGTATILHGGGVWPMIEQVLLIFCAGMLNGVLEQSGMLQTILQVLIQRIRTATSLMLSTVLLSVAMALLACNQALSVIVPGRSLRETYAEMGVSSRYLVRSLADSGVVVSALIPWNLHGILCSTAMGIATGVYFPYAFYLWGSLLLTLLLAVFVRERQNSDKIDK